ncbi:TonB-dependent siderophore receptor [Bordetella genomosp. 12]|uniref:TonB-dependent siderophore receptor n=2 Tax=Bordetella genomosp. 12 TaxID=463035 RepID=A0A261VF09_9BORD|nr:TonB-dependent siderophore receptor [Bordetella genomosp. 12]
MSIARLGRGCLAVLAAMPAMSQADSAAVTASPVDLPAISIQAAGQLETDFRAGGPPQVNKSNASLAETPQTVTVVPRSVLDSQQAQTLADALHDVPGVVANNFGRRGWDDVIIRGQKASDALFVDGLRVSTTNRIAQELFGVEQVEVIKGPASLLYGQVLPGGLVNMVSKRPRADRFAEAGITTGSHHLYQGTMDVGTPLSADGKAALRINALARNTRDATDYVWSRNRWVAPSLSLDVGPRTDVTLLASVQQRTYVRQQGLPLSGSIAANPHGPVPRRRFTGEPDQAPYRGRESRLGYALSHRFDSGWTLHQNFRHQQFRLDGQFVASGKFLADARNLRRTASDQHWDGSTIALDTHVQRRFLAGPWGEHELTAGVDYLRSRQDAVRTNCAVRPLDVYAPNYGGGFVCAAKPRLDTRTTIRDLGIYVRDQVTLAERWRLLAGLRHDRAATRNQDQLAGKREAERAQASTGSAALMYEISPGVRPYASYATSFTPNAGTDINGDRFVPERGRQWELGAKLELDGGAMQLNLAAFELRRRNVLQSDPLHDGFSIAVGEQRSRGAEIGLVADLSHGLSLMGGYAYTAAVITDDGGQMPSTEGQRLNNVPRHSFTLYSRYALSGEAQGWELNAGLRGESKRYAYGYFLPGYVVADLGVAYRARRWRAALTIKNVFDKQYYAGGLIAAVALGNDRAALFTVGYHY